MNNNSILFWVNQNRGKTVTDSNGERLKYDYDSGKWKQDDGTDAKPTEIFPKPIYARVTINGRRKEISTGLMIKPDKWDMTHKRMKGNSMEANKMRADLRAIEDKINDTIRKINDKGQYITPELFTFEFEGGEDQAKTWFLSDVMDAYLESKRNDHAHHTQVSVVTNFNSLRQFCEETFGKKDVPIHVINRKDIFHRYTGWCSQKGHAASTINGRNSYLGALLKFATEVVDGFVMAPAQFSRKKVKPTFKNYTDSEQAAIIKYAYEKNNLNNNEQLLLKCHIFQIETGLSVGEFKHLTYDNITVKTDGKRYLMKNREKTGVLSSIPLSPQAEELIKEISLLMAKSTKKNQKRMRENFLLPSYTTTSYYNLFNKMGKHLGIKLNTHKGRHTFGTNMLNAGYSMEAVSKMMGHASIITTERNYAEFKDKLLINERGRVEGDYENSHNYLSNRAK